MSLSLGQSVSYINKIENKRALPSMTGFLYICEYFGITPQEFFSPAASPTKQRETIKELEKLDPDVVVHVLQLLRDLNK